MPEKTITRSILDLQKGPESVEIWVQDGQLVVQFPDVDEPKHRIPSNLLARLEIEALTPNAGVTVPAYGRQVDA